MVVEKRRSPRASGRRSCNHPVGNDSPSQACARRIDNRSNWFDTVRIEGSTSIYALGAAQLLPELRGVCASRVDWNEGDRGGQVMSALHLGSD